MKNFSLVKIDFFLETMCPINRQSAIDELVLALTTPIKSVISRDQWKLSSILLRISNMSFGGLPATAARYVFEGSNEFKNLPAQQSVQERDQLLRNKLLLISL